MELQEIVSAIQEDKKNSISSSNHTLFSHSTKEKVMSFVEENKTMTITEISRLLGVDSRNIYNWRKRRGTTSKTYKIKNKTNKSYRFKVDGVVIESTSKKDLSSYILKYHQDLLINNLISKIN